MSRSSRILTPLGVLLPLLMCVAAHAGTICGTVRDISTNGPIAAAGVFVRTQAGAYTGYYGATDGSGSFCINSVPPGTYDLEVRVDDYQVGYVRNVTVSSTTDVVIPATLARLDLAPPAPNPARDRVRFRFVLSEAASVSLVVSDVHGRILRGWEGQRLAAGPHHIDWDLHDRDGRSASAGLYFVRLVAGPLQRVRAFVRIR